ncbi:ElaB/YqjD/DUF883 family membrane-anchored ribosome-binding protein [Sphingomonas sp. BE138]|uniref:hypothetical protein n=1 Tax=Sphingomonas sp. BE138 TaxID=2817845 RepID=UPI002866B9B5|nr:hypothetical protein [Sphingomonas sp. BE138]MDR6789613.1 ElaB/YqjD/DUF883 family membrane-anchored ribosome-binding protein [Sphingomonas sp. BE138]
MADEQDRDTLQQTTAADASPPPADAAFTPAAPLKDAGVDFSPEDGASSDTGTVTGGGSTIADAKQTVIDQVSKGREQAADKARGLAEDGKAKATDALAQLSQLLTDAAGQVDEKLGAQYGQYARSAADRVQGFSSAIDQKSIDDLLDDARALVRKSPEVAIGVAAGVGFVVARLIGSAVDQRDA